MIILKFPSVTELLEAFRAGTDSADRQALVTLRFEHQALQRRLTELTERALNPPLVGWDAGLQAQLAGATERADRAEAELARRSTRKARVAAGLYEGPSYATATERNAAELRLKRRVAHIQAGVTRRKQARRRVRRHAGRKR